jgi:hypothetical protein
MMAFTLLSRMEEIRLNKEKSLNYKEVTTPLIALGTIILMIGILIFGYTGLIAAAPAEGSSSGADGTGSYAICVGVSCLFGLIGIFLALVGIIQIVISQRAAQTNEGEYQKLRSQLLTVLAESESR